MKYTGVTIGTIAPLNDGAELPGIGTGMRRGARMHVRSRRILAVAVDHRSSRPTRRLSFALADTGGDVVREGHLPAEVDAEALVIADYGLLDRPEILRLGVRRTCLVAPRSAALGSGYADADPRTVLRAWLAEKREARAIVREPDLDALRGHLEARSALIHLRDQMLEQIGRRVGAASREYLAIVSRDGSILPEAMALLREYPTPRLLDETGIIELTRAIEQAGSGSRPTIDRLLRLAEAPMRPHDPPASELAEALLPGDIERHLILQQQLYALDLRIYRTVRPDPAPEDLDSASFPSDTGRFSLFTDSPSSTTRQPCRSGVAPAQSLRIVEEVYARRCAPERSPRADYEIYRAAREPLDVADLPVEDALRLETVGQHLALAAGSFFDAIRYRTAADRLLAAEGEEGSVSPRTRADAALTNAVTEVCAVDLVQGFSSLRAIVEGEFAASACSELLTEALGLMGLIIVLFGEHHAYPEVLRGARARIPEHGGCSSSRAPIDITELFLVSSRPETSAEEFETVRERADQHSRDTVYRSFYHYVMMLSTYTTKDVERGLHHYTLIKQDGLWARFNRRFDRLANLSYAIHLAARGEFATARRQLVQHQTSYKSISDGADFLIQGLFQLRMDLAVGRHQSVLAETMPDGPFGELQIQGVHLRRYAPISLVLRGTALLREGERELAFECFTRATQQSVMSEEWFALLAGETLEYRAWLESIDPSDPEGLPAGLRPEVLAGVLSRPVLLQHTLDPLTPQQTRILRFLAQERSAASIAAELHISSNTLKTHLRQLYHRLGVRSRAQAVVYAEMYGLL